MKDNKFRLFVYSGVFAIIFICGVLIALSTLEITHQEVIKEEQLKIMKDNRKWAEQIGSWEVRGADEKINEGIEVYNTALSNYHAAVRAQALTYLLIIISCGIIIIIGGIFLKYLKNQGKMERENN